MNLKDILDKEILPLVEKPSRYLGTEVNAVQKDLDGIEVRLALGFPDVYDLGLGNLGIHILYSCVNKLDWAYAERVYAPGKDMERELRARGLNLFTLETKDTLDQMDGIGLTLQSELTYTNILNIIDMAGVPLRTENREDHHPLTFAGGPAVFNPEPLAPFMDFFVMGDGEDVILEICEVFRELKGQPRSVKLARLAQMEGVYVPALYPMDVMEDGRVLPALDGPMIRKRTTRDLNGATFPTDYIVPYTQQVHDRVSLEVLRGCTQGCRFCQAGMVTRPVRERKLEKVEELLETTLKKTGYEEVSLVSLSTCDHSRVRKLVENTVEAVKDKHVAVSLPSLRLDSFSVDLADMVAQERRSGLTFAPEAASPRLRSVINKWIPDEDLLNMSAKAYSKGWGHVKLYFMIGLPTERDDDVIAIADLAGRTVHEGRKINPKARVNLGVSTFVPKPFTPFQWAPQLDMAEIHRRQDVLEKHLDTRHIKFGRHEAQETYLEGLVSRADRRAGDLLELAFRKGCRFDAWREHLDFKKWLEAVEELNYDVAFELRERDLNERLPWDHIDVHIPKSWFQADWQRATELKHAPDCRHKRCHKCGVIDVERELCASMLRDNIEGRKMEAKWERKESEPYVEPEPAQRIRFRIGRTGGARFLSHLESLSAWIRSFRRVETPLAYSRGFHPHPKIAFSSAMPVGIDSVGEYVDITLTKKIDVADLLVRLRETLPDGFHVFGGGEIPVRASQLMAINNGSSYVMQMPHESFAAVSDKLSALLVQDEWLVQRTVKRRKGKRRFRVPTQVDLRHSLQNATVSEENGVVVLRCNLVGAGGERAKVRELLREVAENPEHVRVLRVDTVFDNAGVATSISETWGAEGHGSAPALQAHLSTGF